MSRPADRISHSDQLRSLREQASAVLGRAGPAAHDAASHAASHAADTVTARAGDAGRVVSDSIRQALTYLPAVLDMVASFRSRSVHAAEGAVGRATAVLPSAPTRSTVMSTVRPVLLGMALVTAGYAAYRIARRR